MPVLEINYSSRDTMPSMLEAKAKELDITVEQLVKRFITEGMSEFNGCVGQSSGASSLEDFKVLNDIIKPM